MLIISFSSSQANESDTDEQHYGDYAMDFIAGEGAKFWQWDDFCSSHPSSKLLLIISLVIFLFSQIPLLQEIAVCLNFSHFRDVLYPL